MTMYISRKTLVVFAGGMLFGFFVTRLFIQPLSESLRMMQAEVQVMNGLIPESPHSHGEFDNVGIVQSGEQKWDDFAEEQHSGIFCRLNFGMWEVGDAL